jgi:Carboxypeptidase regulatory-like domain
MRPSLAILCLAGLAATTNSQQPTAATAAAVTVTLRGQVTSPGQGRVRVTVWHNDMQKRSIDAIAEGFAADDGTFCLRDVPWQQRQQWGMHKIIVVGRQPGHQGLVELRGDDAPIDAIRLQLGPTVDLRGTLRAEHTNAPIADAWIWPAIFGDAPGGRNAAWLTSPLLLWHARTDADGKFLLRGLPPLFPYKLMAGHADFAHTWIDAPAATTVVDARLPRGGRIRGRVLLPDGKPAVRVLVASAAVGAGYGDATTDEQGHFEITSLPADTYKVWAEAPDLTVIAVQNLVVEAGNVQDAKVVQLVHGGFIEGRLVDAATGAPVAPGPSTDVAMYGPARGDGGACECTPVRPDGTFRIRAPAGRNRIYLRAAEGWSEPSEVVEVREGVTTAVEWRLQRPKAVKGS